ncbi:DMSO/TMAO reductase YedYZ molybdopterin-dependent catalytic subunit [Sphingomonas jinjuensis]|uniref:DMSO/TMAO reductase YedYZ molybdopterin-dependent catalytic subunit n=1 Tax=Sphingomonas jinjuensis TaxID=535907 RepID=A0A840FGB9_9SPHN|nr:molybdopterin-dependent oxidoreductase [Sphingomonas jinjuensis]MBB4154764.1 DMSO/TMAO reductase YedYZ molybdopterin-dependent catalytic subunit [Sphingomonas jinjuensis]
MIARRTLIAGGAGLMLAGCEKVVQVPAARAILFAGEDMHRGLQRALQGRDALAPEYRRDQMSPIFRANGTFNPNTPDYNALVADKFAGYRLAVGGLADAPRSFTLVDLASMPARRQITRHDCVEGWSAIGEWQGPLLGTVLKAAGVWRSARYVVFRCFDLYGGQPYYESIDLVDAFHPQTILALAMNGRALDVAHGAPVRLRVERQLGYKHAKYVQSIEAVATLDGIGKGKGGYWEDNVDYDWYAGI